MREQLSCCRDETLSEDVHAFLSTFLLSVVLEILRDIRARLMPVLGRMYSRRQLNEFVAVCHAIAVGAVRTRARTLRFLTRFSFANDADVAYECISDLFRQDEKGTILQVAAYFEGIDCTHATDQELLIHLRRLVFSKVNYGLFRLLNEADPALGKILRNTRLACQTLQNFDVIERFGDPCLVPAMCDPLEHLRFLIRPRSNGSCTTLRSHRSMFRDFSAGSRSSCGNNRHGAGSFL